MVFPSTVFSQQTATLSEFLMKIFCNWWTIHVPNVFPYLPQRATHIAKDAACIVCLNGPPVMNIVYFFSVSVIYSILVSTDHPPPWINTHTPLLLFRTQWNEVWFRQLSWTYFFWWANSKKNVFLLYSLSMSVEDRFKSNLAWLSQPLPVLLGCRGGPSRLPLWRPGLSSLSIIIYRKSHSRYCNNYYYNILFIYNN